MRVSIAIGFGAAKLAITGCVRERDLHRENGPPDGSRCRRGRVPRCELPPLLPNIQSQSTALPYLPRSGFDTREALELADRRLRVAHPEPDSQEHRAPDQPTQCASFFQATT